MNIIKTNMEKPNLILCKVCKVNKGYSAKAYKCLECNDYKICLHCKEKKHNDKFEKFKKICNDCNKLKCDTCKKTFINNRVDPRTVKIICNDCKENNIKRCKICEYVGEKEEFKNNFCKSCFNINKYNRSKINEDKNRVKKEIIKSISDNNEEEIRKLKLNTFLTMLNSVEFCALLNMDNEQINDLFEYCINYYSDNKSDISKITDLDNISFSSVSVNDILSICTKDLDNISVLSDDFKNFEDENL
jgi:hypothetical protein